MSLYVLKCSLLPSLYREHGIFLSQFLWCFVFPQATVSSSTAMVRSMRIHLAWKEVYNFICMWELKTIITAFYLTHQASQYVHRLICEHNNQLWYLLWLFMSCGSELWWQMPWKDYCIHTALAGADPDIIQEGWIQTKVSFTDTEVIEP